MTQNERKRVIEQEVAVGWYLQRTDRNLGLSAMVFREVGKERLRNIRNVLYSVVLVVEWW